MRVKRMINFMAGLLFVGIFCLNSGAFGYVPSGEAYLASEKGAEQVRLSSDVVFIDPAVQDAEIIVAQLPEGAEVVRLSPGMDGVAQISAHLAEKRDLSAIRIISHGNAGHFVLNGKRIDGDFLRDHGDRISAWGRALAENGDILLYACNLGVGAAGRQFVETVAELIEADISASTDITGKGGDWKLEHACGFIESAPLDIHGYVHHLANQVVINNNDSGVGSLREAIAAVGSGEEITFNADYTITLASQLSITKSMTITGRGEANTIISGANTYRVFNITAGTVNMSNMTITNGKVTGTADGGAIRNAAALTLTNVTISNSETAVADGAAGGGIYCGSDDSLTLNNSTVSGNTSHRGGGIYHSSGTLFVTDSTIDDNTATYWAGGIAIFRPGATIRDTTISNNKSTGSFGGGIGIDGGYTGETTINGCTFTSNTANTASGAGLRVAGGTVIFEGTNTFSGNIGGGVDNGIRNQGIINFTDASTLNIGDAFTNTGIFNAGSSTVDYNKAAAQTIENVTYNNLSTSGSGIKTLGGVIEVNGNLTIGSGTTLDTKSGSNYAIDIAGNWSNSGTFTAQSGTVTFDGTTAQELTGGTTFYDLTVNNAAGVTLNAYATVNHTLALTDGIVTLGDNDLTLGADATVSGDQSVFNMVVTNGTGVFKKVFSAIGSFAFPVGDNTGTAEYSPATLNFSSGTFAGGAYGTVGVTNARQPDNTSPTDYLNRYWTVRQDGITGFSCDTTFNYLQADVEGTEADIHGGQWDGSSWTVLNAVDAANDRFQATVSGFSDFTGVEGGAPATQASDIGFGSVAQTQMQVSWTRGNGDNVLIVAHQGSAVNSNPVDGTSYNANAAFGSGSQIGSGNYVVYKGTGTSVTVTGLTANTAYHFRVYEYNETGIEERYNTNTATNNPNNKTTLPNAAGVPSATAATSITQTGFSANWNAATGATGYRLDVSTQNDFSTYVTGYQDKDVGNLTTISVSGLSGGTTYYYRVRAVNAGGTSGNSNTITATTLSQAPVATDATSITETGFSANWNAATGAAGYRLDVATDNGFTSFVSGYENKDVGNVTTFSVTGLSAVTAYFYRVRAWHEGGASENSNIISATTTDGTGVPAEIQDAAPNNGDGNGDGIRDSKQTTVASLPSATGGGYITVAITGCDQIEQVQAHTYESVVTSDHGYSYPFGLLGFEIPCSSATVRIYYHCADSLGGYIYRKYGPTPADWVTSLWYTMHGATFGTKVIGVKTVPYAEFDLTESELGDDTNGFPIIDQGGPAQQGTTTIPTSIPTLNEWGIIILSLLIAVSAFIVIQRRQQG